ncbi:hypothetical protein FJR48_07095 [Sulfurimonas lithotrophica]|uniref:Vitamin K epoxide reductase n=1 Tax=Sulfurimonas lithotrophica TaxID=2590022 RepID=A0A5P8P1D3_9BACT|nr:hypothetical protein [Sulfurimonas lithotrophica]QFR49509.1 hypothetical protein FJR48_07095 [Sulfurimonas lithotrophica]
MILSPEILTIYILDFLFFVFGLIALYLSVKIYLKYDKNSSDPLQYSLERQSYLATTIIKYIFIVKVPLFLFFIFTLDKLSNVLSGAMCGAGVLDATDYGTMLITLKVLNIYLFAFWLVLNTEDVKNEKQPYIKMKFALFIVLFALFLSEILIEFYTFYNFEIDKLVSCCGTLYSSTSDSIVSSLFSIDNNILVSVFYANFALITFAYVFKSKYVYAISNLIFIIVSIISMIMFFGTYIYELPSHHCPFCYLQSDYYYVGYLIYALLFIGTFNGLIVLFKDKFFKLSFISNLLFVLLVSGYVVVYYLKNGVFL